MLYTSCDEDNGMFVGSSLCSAVCTPTIKSECTRCPQRTDKKNYETFFQHLVAHGTQHSRGIHESFLTLQKIQLVSATYLQKLYTNGQRNEEIASKQNVEQNVVRTERLVVILRCQRLVVVFEHTPHDDLRQYDRQEKRSTPYDGLSQVSEERQQFGTLNVPKTLLSVGVKATSTNMHAHQ